MILTFSIYYALIYKFFENFIFLEMILKSSSFINDFISRLGTRGMLLPSLISFAATIYTYAYFLNWTFAIVLIGTTLIHEMGHLEGARRSGARFKSMYLWFSIIGGGMGFKLENGKDTAEPEEDAVLSFGGPFLSFFGCLAVVIAVHIYSPFLSFSSWLALSMTIAIDLECLKQKKGHDGFFLCRLKECNSPQLKKWQKRHKLLVLAYWILLGWSLLLFLSPTIKITQLLDMKIFKYTMSLMKAML